MGGQGAAGRDEAFGSSMTAWAPCRGSPQIRPGQDQGRVRVQGGGPFRVSPLHEGRQVPVDLPCRRMVAPRWCWCWSAAPLFALLREGANEVSGLLRRWIEGHFGDLTQETRDCRVGGMCSPGSP